MKAIFRAWRREPFRGRVIAILPEVEANPGKYEMYEHVGQHGEGDYPHVVSQTRLATPAEYADLKCELEQIYGEPIQPIKRLRR